MHFSLSLSSPHIPSHKHQVVGFFVSRWPIFAHLRLSDGPLGASEPDSTYCIRPATDSAHCHLHPHLPDRSLGESVSAHIYSIIYALSGLKLPWQSQGEHADRRTYVHTLINKQRPDWFTACIASGHQTQTTMQ